MTKKKYIKIILLFTLLFIGVLLYSTKYRTDVKIHNIVNDLTHDVKEMYKGDYTLKLGHLYYDDTLISNKTYENLNGTLNVDKYKNVKLMLINSKRKVYKNYSGKILVTKKELKFEPLTAKINKNNSQVSLIVNRKDFYYKISDKDDFNGTWTYNPSDTLILSMYTNKNIVVWCKDKDGVLSNKVELNSSCLESSDNKFDKSVYYCTGSTVVLDDINWTVIKSNNEETILMTEKPIDAKLEHCNSNESEHCYIIEGSRRKYSWSTSYVNYYLNKIYIGNLSNKTINMLKDNYICNEYSNTGCEDNGGCGGYLKKEIESYNYYCDNYVSSKIRLITYNEYNYAFENLNDLTPILGNYWILNSYGNEYGALVEKRGNIFIKADLTQKNNVRPVIVISRD